jgi:hypothetical protein
MQTSTVEKSNHNLDITQLQQQRSAINCQLEDLILGYSEVEGREQLEQTDVLQHQLDEIDKLIQQQKIETEVDNNNLILNNIENNSQNIKNNTKKIENFSITEIKEKVLQLNLRIDALRLRDEKVLQQHQMDKSPLQRISEDSTSERNVQLHDAFNNCDWQLDDDVDDKTGKPKPVGKNSLNKLVNQNNKKFTKTNFKKSFKERSIESGLQVPSLLQISVPTPTYIPPFRRKRQSGEYHIDLDKIINLIK